MLRSLLSHLHACSSVFGCSRTWGGRGQCARETRSRHPCWRCVWAVLGYHVQVRCARAVLEVCSSYVRAVNKHHKNNCARRPFCKGVMWDVACHSAVEVQAMFSVRVVFRRSRKVEYKVRRRLATCSIPSVVHGVVGVRVQCVRACSRPCSRREVGFGILLRGLLWV